MEIRPVDLPILRSEIVEDLKVRAAGLYEDAIREKRQWCYPTNMPAADAARLLAVTEIDRTRTADLFYVSKDMTSLAKIAARSLPEFTLMPEDLPSPNGFIYWDEPIWTIDYDDHPAFVVGASWGRWNPGGTWNQRGGLWVTWYVDRDAGIETAQARARYHTRDLERMRRSTARLLLDNESQMAFTPEQVRIWDGDRELDFAEAMEQEVTLLNQCVILKSTWALMSQSIAHVEDATYDRAARRRVERLGQKVPPVRVITLRRPKSSNDHGESDREYHHQWIVRGHWRQQYYPSRDVHRPVWIAPHIKGPEGAPLIGGEKVYAWTR